MRSSEKSVPFQVEENQIREVLREFLMNQETAPLDIMYSFDIKSIVREMYPISFLSVQCSVKWSALSIYEKVTQIPVQKTKTVFIDRNGWEWSYRGSDRVKINGEWQEVPYTPQQKLVTEMVSKTEITSTQRTNGTTDTKTFKEKVVFVDGQRNTPFANWISRMSFSRKQVQDNRVTGVRYIEKTGDVQKVIGTLKETAIQAVSSMAQSQIPGNRYEDLQCVPNCAANEETVYVPVYRVVYTHENRDYKIMINGTDKSQLFYEAFPEDATIVRDIADRAGVLHNEKIKYIAFLSVGILQLIAAIILFVILTDAWDALEALLVSSVFVIVGGVCLALSVKKRKNLKKLQTEAKDKWTALGQLRNQIVTIFKSSDGTFEEKKQRIEKLIKEYYTS